MLSSPVGQHLAEPDRVNLYRCVPSVSTWLSACRQPGFVLRQLRQSRTGYERPSEMIRIRNLVRSRTLEDLSLMQLLSGALGESPRPAYWLLAWLMTGCTSMPRWQGTTLHFFTYIATKKGWLYLAVIMDLFSRRIIGWSMQPTLTGLLMVAASRWHGDCQARHSMHLLHHSDHGSQYASAEYQARLGRAGITVV